MTPDYADLIVMADTVYMEARGEPYRGQRAVANVILNRARKRGHTIRRVCLDPWQFSAWNSAADPNRKALKNAGLHDPVYRQCFRACVEAWDKDETEGSDHYATIDIKPPPWSEKMEETLTLGRHRFWRS